MPVLGHGSVAGAGGGEAAAVVEVGEGGAVGKFGAQQTALLVVGGGLPGEGAVRRGVARLAQEQAAVGGVGDPDLGQRRGRGGGDGADEGAAGVRGEGAGGGVVAAGRVGVAIGDAVAGDFEERQIAEGVGDAIAPSTNCLTNKRSHGLPPLPERKTIFRCRDFPYLSAVHLVFAAAPLLELFRGTA